MIARIRLKLTRLQISQAGPVFGPADKPAQSGRPDKDPGFALLRGLPVPARVLRAGGSGAPSTGRLSRKRSRVLTAARTRGPRSIPLHGLVGLLAGIGVLVVAAPAWAASSGVFAWGDNFRGQLGDGTTASSDVPVAVSGLSRVAAVSGGADDSIALLSNGMVMAWGENGLGQLGDGSTEEKSEVPVAVSGLSEVTAIAAGGNHSLALLRNGTVMAWGYDAFGQLGDGTIGGPETTCNDSLPCSRAPVAVSGLSEVTAIAAGYNYSLALLRDGTVVAWGLNESGALGNGTSAENANPTPAPVSGLSEVTAIAAGLGGVSTALLKNGTVMDWGAGGEGGLGDGTEHGSDVPVAVSGLSGVVALPNGGEGMALLGNGTVVDWGLNAVGELGDGTETGPSTCSGIPCSRTPVAVSGLSGVTAIAGGLEHRLALLSNGTVMSWGNGALGNATIFSSDLPLLVSGLSGAVAVGAGQYFSLAVGTLAPPPTVPVTEGTEPKTPEEPKAPEPVTEAPIEAPAPKTPEPASRPVTGTGIPPSSSLGTVDSPGSTGKRKAQKLCAKKPKNQHAKCERQARKAYAITARKARKR
jgi:alpha-tubulin suppressor-like RCC1 family protein